MSKEWKPKSRVYLMRGGAKVWVDDVHDEDVNAFIRSREEEQQSHNNGKLSGYYISEPLTPNPK